MRIAHAGDGNDATATGFDLRHVRQHLVVRSILRRNTNHRQAVVDEGNRAVLHLAGGVALGVDVAYFFEFERTFEGNRVRQLPAEEQRTARVLQRFGQRGVVRPVVEDVTDLARQGNQRPQMRSHRRRRQHAARLGNPQRQQILPDQHRREGFGRGDADFGPGMQHQRARRGYPRRLTAHRIDDGQRTHAGAAGQFHGRQGIGGLAALTNGDEEHVCIQHRLAVAELRGVIDLHRHTGNLLDHVFTDERGVPGSTAGSHHHRRDVAQPCIIQQHIVQAHGARLEIDATAQDVGQDARLLVDFLQHKVLVRPALDRHRVPCQPRNRPLDGRPIGPTDDQ